LSVIGRHKLEIKDEKTERVIFSMENMATFQYLGFNMTQRGVAIRGSSLARQWRKLKHSIYKTRKIGVAALDEGRSKQIFTKKLRRRFNPVGARNFSAYARRAAKAFGTKQIVRQVSRLERAADEAIRSLKKLRSDQADESEPK